MFFPEPEKSVINKFVVLPLHVWDDISPPWICSFEETPTLHGKIVGFTGGKYSVQVGSVAKKFSWKQLARHLKKPCRTRGLERPFSADQSVSFVVYPGVTALYFGLALSLADTSSPSAPPAIPRVLAANAVLAVCVVSFWAYCSWVDPAAKSGGVLCPCMKTTQQAADRYCRQCKKSVPGLDHHCTWLNTCIGSRNYGKRACLCLPFGTFVSFCPFFCRRVSPRCRIPNACDDVA